MAKKPVAIRPKKPQPASTLRPKQELQKQDRTIALPKAPNKPSDNIEDYSWVIYGEKGIGKSTLAASFPDTAVHFSLEPCRISLPITMVPDPSRNEVPLTWERVKKYHEMLREEYEPGRINYDTADELANLIMAHHAAPRGVATINGIQDHGKAWDTLKNDFQNELNSMIYAGWRMTFVSHVKKRPRVMRGYSREELKEMLDAGLIPNETQPACSGWMFEYLKIPTTFAAYYGYWGPNQRALYLAGYEDIWAANGLNQSHFLQPPGHPREGEPLHILLMPRNPNDAWETLLGYWNNELPGEFID